MSHCRFGNFDQLWCNTNVPTMWSSIFALVKELGVNLSEISDNFYIFALVKELGIFPGNNDSYVTIKCRRKNSERDLMFKSLLEHI